jgi:cysteine desulfurase/selenocysteine lyase
MIKFDANRIREDFPALRMRRNGLPPIYLDSAAGTIPPQSVIDAARRYWQEFPSSVGRSHHWWADLTAQAVYDARVAVAEFLNADVDPTSPDGTKQIVFTQNTTHGINLVARGLTWLEGEVVVTMDREHNSNRTVWWDLAKTRGIVPQVIKRGGSDAPDAEFDVDYFLAELERIDAQIGPVKMVSFAQTFNLDGYTIPDEAIQRITAYCHSPERRRRGEEIYVMMDAAQSVPHRRVDVKKLDADFLCFSLHKMLGLSGTGVCYMKDPDLLAIGSTPSGGGTVTRTFDDDAPIYAAPPRRYEAGLQNWAGIVAGHAAINYLRDKMDWLPAHEVQLNRLITQRLLPFHEDGVILLLGPLDPEKRGSICTFEIPVTPDDRHRFDLETQVHQLCDRWNIMCRSGDYCVHPYAYRNNTARLRASFYLYNTVAECEKFLEAITPFLERRREKGLTFEKMVREEPTAAESPAACGRRG